MKQFLIFGLAGLFLSACIFQESKNSPDTGPEAGIVEDEIGEVSSNYVPKFSNENVLEHMVNGGFSASEIKFEGNDIAYQEDITISREYIEREIQEIVDGSSSLTENGQAGPLAKQQQRALSSNPKVAISEVPKLWYSMSSAILNIDGLDDIIHDSYEEYEDETNFEFVYTTNYTWCKNTPYKCTRWYTSSSISGVGKASWPWKTSTSEPPFKKFTAPGSTIRINPTNWANTSTQEKTILHEIGHTLGYTHSNVAESGTQVIPGTSSTTRYSTMCANGVGTLGDCLNYNYLPYNDRVALKWSGYRTANP